MAPTAKAVEGANALAKRDRLLRGALKSYGVPDLRRGRPRRTHFAELTRMICYQQLAGRAAAAIYGRFEALFDGPPTPDLVLALPMDELRSVGLSGSKAASIVDLAEKVDVGLVQLDRMSRLPDEEVVRELTLVRGIGEWTAHMFLMFTLHRGDVLPTGDQGIKNAVKQAYGLAAVPKPDAMIELDLDLEEARLR